MLVRRRAAVSSTVLLVLCLNAAYTGNILVLSVAFRTSAGHQATRFIVPADHCKEMPLHGKRNGDSEMPRFAVSRLNDVQSTSACYELLQTNAVLIAISACQRTRLSDRTCQNSFLIGTIKACILLHIFARDAISSR